MSEVVLRKEEPVHVNENQEGIKMRKFIFRYLGFTHRMFEEIDGYRFECLSLGDQ